MLPAPEVLDETLVGRTLLFKWASEGWCWGEVTRQNTDRRVKVGGVVANYCVCYEIDGPGSEAKHHLKLDNYLAAQADPNSNGQAQPGTWVLATATEHVEEEDGTETGTDSDSEPEPDVDAGEV